MKTIGELSFLPIWVNPGHRVASVKVLLSGHKVMALGVIEGGKFLGTVGYEDIAAASDSDAVGPFVRPAKVLIEPSETVRAAAEALAREDAPYLPVVRSGEFVGILTAAMLLRELGRSWDPLTGLSWSDALREWGIDRLREGREVTILFLDLDDFGSYNKKFGHIVGDRVLVRVAAFLRNAVDPELDVLCRYGGDEFAIGTIRSRRETEELLASLERGLQGTLVAESDQPVRFSAGVFGGRRTKERENVHYSATLDTLINRASKEAMAAKIAKRLEPPASNMEHRLPSEIQIVDVFSSGESAHSTVTVILSAASRVASGVQQRGASTLTQAAALAAAKALVRLVPGFRFAMEEVRLLEDEEGRKLVTVAGILGEGDRLQSVSGTCLVESDLSRAAASALLEAARSSN